MQPKKDMFAAENYHVITSSEIRAACIKGSILQFGSPKSMHAFLVKPRSLFYGEVIYIVFL